MILLSDLEILPDEVQRLVAVFADLRQRGLRGANRAPLAASGAAPADRAASRRPIAASGAQSGEEAVRAPGEESLTAGLPWLFLLVGPLARCRARGQRAACWRGSR